MVSSSEPIKVGRVFVEHTAALTERKTVDSSTVLVKVLPCRNSRCT